MTYTVEITEMQSGELFQLREFTTLAAAQTYFQERCDAMNLDNQSHYESDLPHFEAGGIGYDYRIELYTAE